MSDTEVFGWKFSKFINNKNYDFNRDKILEYVEKIMLLTYDLISVGKIITTPLEEIK